MAGAPIETRYDGLRDRLIAEPVLSRSVMRDGMHRG